MQKRVGLNSSIRSTEELCSLLEEYNKSVKDVNMGQSTNKTFIASMDVTSLYPLLKTEATAKEIKDTILESDIIVKDVNWRALGIFLRKNMTTYEIAQCKFCEYIPSQRKRNKEHRGKVHESDLWIFGENEPVESVIKDMLAESISKACILIMNNHVYKFSEKFYVQENEGSIGVTFTGIAAEIKMLRWCLKLKVKLQKLNIKNHLQSRLVDDITLIPESIKPGMKVVDDKLVFCSQKEKEDRDISDDIRTMTIIQEIANNLDKDIKVTFDVPSLHSDKMVPILDLKVRMNEEGYVEHIFYRKPMASTLVTHKESALSTNSKFTILTQECFRRLHNTTDNVSITILAITYCHSPEAHFNCLGLGIM